LIILYGIAVGALFGAILGALLHAATGGTRDFSSVAGMRSDRYEILVDEDVAERAEAVLSDLR
jgi:hypothetical protein